MNCRWGMVLGLVCVAMCAPAERLCGLERLERIDRLPELLEGTRALQVSSRDRRGGNMGDGYYATHPYLYTDAKGEFVLFDEKTPGCLYRFWMTFTDPSVRSNRLRFYFDGETVARLEMTVDEWFSGANPPFVHPLVGDASVSCKGYYSYYPFEYEAGLKITIDSVPTGSGYSASPFYYNITYHQFDSALGVQTWDGTEPVSNVVDLLNRIGQDPKPTNGNLRVAGSLSIPGNSSSSLFSSSGGGVVQSIKLDPSPASVDVLRNCRLVMDWDGGRPEVDVPLGNFFGSARNEMDIASLPIGMSSSGGYYCYFPMPFWASADIRLVNESGAAVQLPYEVQYTTTPPDQALNGYFHASYKDQFIGDDGRDVNFITTSGRGHFVGLSLYILGLDYSGNNLDHLEGDERIYFDGSRSPAIYGTGTEDYFNCAWYFNGAPALLPYHGVGLQEFNPAPPNSTQAYRFHMGDVLPFYSDFRFGMEHGRRNDTSGVYSSMAYFYKQDEPGWVRTAQFRVADGDVFSYQAVGAETATNAWRFEGEDDQVTVGAEGVAFSGSSSFGVPVATNAGVVLRRLTDRGVGGQKASVFVDGTFAGTWYDADSNFVTQRLYNTSTYLPVEQRWNESDFLLPAMLTAGKTNLNISVVRDPDGAEVWNEYEYSVFCIPPLGPPGDVDADGLPDRWEVDYYNNIGEAVPGEDTDSDGFETTEEYIGGTSPVDGLSRFELDAAGGVLGWDAHEGRLYSVWHTTNLVEGAWGNVTNFIGQENFHDLLPGMETGFYRVDVRLAE